MKSTKQKRYDVFISYSSRDQKVVEGLCAYLEQHKIRCFVAYRDVPFDAPWAESIVDALESSRMMLVVFSNNYNKSRQVDREIEIASEENLPILTFRLSDDQYVGAKRFYLKNLNWIDAFPHPEATFGRVTENVAKLLGLSLNREEGASGGDGGSGSGSGSGGSVVERPRKRNGLILPIASLLVVIAVVCIALLINKSDGGGEPVPTEEISIAVETSSEETLIAVDALQPPQPKAPQATAAQPQKNAAQTTITTPQVQQKGTPTPIPKPRQESTSKSVPTPKAQEPQKPAKAPASQQVKQTTSKEVEPNSAAAVKTYKVGDYYDDGTKQGVVFEVSDDGRYGKIVSLTQSSEKLQWAVSAVSENKIGADSRTDGAANMKKVQTISGWRELYPAFRWCAELGEGWYLPAVEELQTLLLNDSVHNAVNATLKARGATCLYDEGGWVWYWSSTEYPNDEISAWNVNMNRGYTGSNNRYVHYYVRAVATICFDAEKKIVTATATKTYKVGDYYDDGTKQGVVFEVTDGGRHGKIVSLTQSALHWAVDAVYENKIGAGSSTDGAANMKKVQAISGWRELYPAFRWCAELGEGWYLPAIEELQTFLLDDSVHNAVNATLKARGATRLYDTGGYWSSTEYPNRKFCAWSVNMYNGDTSDYNKLVNNYVRAVSAF